MPSRAEPTQKGNPHKLTVRQHVFPVMSIERFAGSDGCVDLADGERCIRRRAKPRDHLFCADRDWSHSTETGYMKRIEDAFQALANTILHDPLVRLEDSENQIATDFYALWHVRSRRRHLDQQYISNHEILAGENTTKDQQEILEKKGYMTNRADGSFAARDINGSVIWVGMGQLKHSVLKDASWGVVRTDDGEFCVPDAPAHGAVPISPHVALILNNDSGLTDRKNVAALNAAMKQAAHQYIFARSLDACPGIMPLWNETSDKARG